MTKTLAATVALGALTAASQAALTPLDSTSFLKQFEMNGSSILPDDNDPEWYYAVGGGGSYSGAQGGGKLDLVTSGDPSAYIFVGSDTYPGLISPGAAFTFEVSVQVTASSVDEASSDRAFHVIGGDGAAYSKFEVGLTTVWFSNTIIASGLNNSDGQHIYRVAKDGDTDLYTIWRDNVLLASDLGGLSHTFVDLYLGDGTGGWNGTSSTDYFRWTLGGHSPIPEPAALGMLALGTLLLGRRRGA